MMTGRDPATLSCYGSGISLIFTTTIGNLYGRMQPTHVLPTSVGQWIGVFVGQWGPTSVQFGSPARVVQFGPVRVQVGVGQVRFPDVVGQPGPLCVQAGAGQVTFPEVVGQFG